jgi:EAL domain-containing protein (putative c-di-GMP-specific phosphodiesterase class I)/ActR/RegA family two-component response regulator
MNSFASVLIVDDSRVQRDHAAALCREVGIAKVQVASNGHEALALLAAPKPTPDLLILDLEMPTMDGSQLLEQLQLQRITVPIIVVSARDQALIEFVGDMAGVLGLEVIGELQKPLSMDALRHSLCRFSTPKTHARVSSALVPTAQELAAAIEAGELDVHYQPKVDIRTGIVRGVEALVRWHHPTLGFVPPAGFTRLAEQNGLIRPLTQRVMTIAMCQAAEWMSQGLPLSLAINLSPLLLERSDLTDEIFSIQEIFGVPPQRVTFEITESTLLNNSGIALGVLARLRLRGFGLAIDDYGTGFSSMQQLTRIPFTELKIDRSFVHNAHERVNLQVILRSALDMANKLGLTTVAEGVENLEDWRLLQEYGCALGQGFLIAKAMTAKDLIPWLEAHDARRGELIAVERVSA